jgi:hypothetical protein
MDEIDVWNTMIGLKASKSAARREIVGFFVILYAMKNMIIEARPPNIGGIFDQKESIAYSG